MTRRDRDGDRKTTVARNNHVGLVGPIDSNLAHATAIPARVGGIVVVIRNGDPTLGTLACDVSMTDIALGVDRVVADSAERLSAPVIFSLGQALDFLADDELHEVTPRRNLCLRKRLLSHHYRSRARERAALN